MTKLLELVDAIELIADDLEGSGLPPHTLETFARPNSIQAEHCPLLAIWPERFGWELIATPALYELKPTIAVGWWESASLETESGGANLGGLVRSTLTVVERIVSMMQLYCEKMPPLIGTYGALKETEIVREGLVLGAITRLELER